MIEGGGGRSIWQAFLYKGTGILMCFNGLVHCVLQNMHLKIMRIFSACLYKYIWLGNQNETDHFFTPEILTTSCFLGDILILSASSLLSVISDFP